MGMYGNDEHPIIETLIDGVWTDVSERVRGDQKVNIKRGRSSEQGRASAQRCNLTFDNPDGFFSTRLPTSVNYRKFGKNTQLRVRAGSDSANYLKLPYNEDLDPIGAFTVDKAVLDVTGDLDIRMEIEPHTWRPGAAMVLASKWTSAGNQRSWAFLLNADGRLSFEISTAGTTSNVVVTSTIPVPAATKRLAVRFTIDVDNGSGGRSSTFYTAPAIGGTYTVFGAGFGGTPNITIFASTTNLAIGGGANGRNVVSNSKRGFGGKITGFELRSGINGTLVADFKPGAKAIGSTSWSDGLGTPNTWTISGLGARVTSDRVRFWGEIPYLQSEWDKTGTDVTMPSQASGLMRRLGQGAKPLGSPMSRALVQYPGIYAWWPLEDGSLAVSGSNAIAGGSAATALLTRFGDSSSGLPGASATMSFTDAASRLTGSVGQVPANTGTASLYFYVKVGALPATEKIICTAYTTGTIRKVQIGLTTTTWVVRLFDVYGTQLSSSAELFGTGTNPSLAWVGFNLLLQQNGANVDYSRRWDAIGAPGLGAGPTSIATATVRPFTSITFSSTDAVFNNMQLSHVFLSTVDLPLGVTTGALQPSNAYFGEGALARLVRLGQEENQPIEITGYAVDSVAMGYQSTKTFLELLYECWDADGGIGGEARDALALTYRTRVDLERRSDCTLNYSTSDLSEVPKPTNDDQGLVNDATAVRTGGGSRRFEVTEGPNSVSDPTAVPPGAGRYDTSTQVNIALDDALQSIAGWIALVGSWDADRYPQVTVAMHRNRLLGDAALTEQVLALNVGDTITLTDLPAWMPPDDVPEIVQGYSEQLGRFLWELTFNGTPGGPYQAVAVLGSDVYPARLDATTHTIGGSGLTTTATSVSLVTQPGSARWVDSATYPAEFPMDLVIGGEVVTLTVVTGTSSPQTGTITRSVNGIVKSHPVGESTRLARPIYIGR